MKKIIFLLTFLIWLAKCGPAPRKIVKKHFPCTNNNNISSTFEPGVSLKAETRYIITMVEAIPANAYIRIKFDSEAYVTSLIETGDNTSARTTMKPGVVFIFSYFEEYRTIKFIVTSYVPGIVPYITSITINGVEICTQPNVGFLNKYVVQPYLNDEEKNCGRRQVIGTELIVNSQPTKAGDWPWHAAIYKLVGNAMKYICGGTLISKYFVLTAAHCVSVRGSALLPDVLSVVLGKYNLIGGDIGSKEKEIHRIILHQHFEPRKLDNDIALIELNTEVKFSDYIQPSCLWYKRAFEKLPTNTIMGTVVGWGFDIHGNLSQQLREVKMPIVNDIECIISNPFFYSNVLDENKFCAGFHNGTSACNGDGGGGLVVFVPDESGNNKLNAAGSWHVRGIVSVTIFQTDRAMCDPDQYVVFTDVEKYKVWIKSYLTEKENSKF